MLFGRIEKAAMKSRDTRTKACGEAQGTVTRAAMKSQEKGQRIKSIDGIAGQGTSKENNKV